MCIRIVHKKTVSKHEKKEVLNNKNHRYRYIIISIKTMKQKKKTIELKQGKYLENFLKNFCEIYSQVLWIFNLIYQYYYGPMIGQLMAKKPFMIVYSSRKHSSIIMLDCINCSSLKINTLSLNGHQSKILSQIVSTPKSRL